ncbi:solute carrier family 22 member 7-like [Chanos chanos]|uniref:Solute carrier family 22 member 6 n=1 Tax=Chanos chanos TaxID=29144 RepID=A0A6J2WCY9_CHACN|nr:solute carrier family 22 member 7-like [Chanos chanos]
MKFEDLLSEINGFGRFQKTVLFITFVGRFTLPCHFLLNNYIAAIPSHHCDISSLDGDDGLFGNLSLEERLTVSVPVMESGKLSSCQMFSEPQFHLLVNSNSTGAPTVQCQNGWVYDNTTFTSTIATQWDLVCENRGLNKATTTIFFVGVMFGAMMFGSLSDRYGRKTTLLISYLTAMVFAMSSAFASSFIMFAVLRFFTGFSITGIVIVSSVLNVEWVDIERRKLVGVIDSLGWSFGYMLLPWIAYGVRDWRYLTIAVTSPLAIAIITWRWIPESARWLIASGQLDKAHYFLKQCASKNRREGVASKIKPETLSCIVMTEKVQRKYSYVDLVRTPKMRRLAALTGFTWYGVASTYYGISFNIAGFGLDLYLNQFLYGFIEFPAKICLYFLFDKMGRRRIQVGALLFAGLSLVINLFIPKDQWIVRTVVSVLGKGFSSASFTTAVLYSSELYPTVVRQNGMGYNSFMARLGVAIAPLILLLEDMSNTLPQVILGSIAVVAALLARLLPETQGRCLPETIEDIEGTGKTRNKDELSTDNKCKTSQKYVGNTG